jgi:hypothetical protein
MPLADLLPEIGRTDPNDWICCQAPRLDDRGQRLFAAQETGASDEQLREIVAEGLLEIYFKDGGRAW